MNKKSIYFVTAIIAIAGILLFYILRESNTNVNFGDNSSIIQPSSNVNEITSTQDSEQIRELELELNNVSISQIQNNQTELQLIFDVYNPIETTIVLENIHYYVYSNNSLLTAGDIGETPEGFITSSEGIYPVISNGTVTLKDTKTLQSNVIGTELFNKIANGEAIYEINGTYSYRQTSSLQAIDGENSFNFTFPSQVT